VIVRAAQADEHMVLSLNRLHHARTR
jgi:hypothetical protein